MRKVNPSLKRFNAHLSPGHVAKLLRISPAILRTYELEGLVVPSFKKGRKCYSYEHINWLTCMRFLVEEKGISIPGLTRLLQLAPCWEIANCSCDTKKVCKARFFTFDYLKKNSSRPPMEALCDQASSEQEEVIGNHIVH